MNQHDHCNYALRMGDSCLILGQRLCEIMGHAPILEEDLSIANIALEQIDQARAWLTLAGTFDENGRDEDAFAYQRSEHEFFNLTLVEQPNGHFGYTVARQLLFSGWQRAWYAAAQESSNPQVATLARKFLPQAEFHWRWAADWTLRLGDGTELSKQRVQEALDSLWKFTGELHEGDFLDVSAAASGFAPSPESLESAWHESLGDVLRRSTLTKPTTDRLKWHGKRGEHGEELGLVLAEMQSLARAHPGATW